MRRNSAQNVFRADVQARDVYLMIASLGYFYNANQYTLGAFLGEPLMEKAALEHWREVIKDTVLRAVRLQLPANAAVNTATGATAAAASTSSLASVKTSDNESAHERGAA